MGDNKYPMVVLVQSPTHVFGCYHVDGRMYQCDLGPGAVPTLISLRDQDHYDMFASIGLIIRPLTDEEVDIVKSIGARIMNKLN